MTRDLTNKENDKIIIVVLSVLSAITPYGIRLVKYYYSEVEVAFILNHNDLFAFCFGIIILLLSEIRHIATSYKKIQVYIIICLILFVVFLGISLYDSYGKEIERDLVEKNFVDFKIQNDSLGMINTIVEIEKCEKGNNKLFNTAFVCALISLIGLLIFMFKFRKK